VTIKDRFRGFLPVVVDIETAGFNPAEDAVLEIAMVTFSYDDRVLSIKDNFAENILPFAGANLNPEALEFNGVFDPYHPLRYALDEKQALDKLFTPVKQEIKSNRCSRAILVGHNPWFDLHFLNAAIKRSRIKSPFHAFASFDTATLGALAYKHTVLAEIVKRAGIDWQDNHAHSAIYDAGKTAEIFCKIINLFDNKTLKPI